MNAPDALARHDDIAAALAQIFAGIEQLKSCCGGARRFTIDGRLVGDIGEIVAERAYGLTLDRVSRKGYDAVTDDGRDVQIKATFKDHLTFTAEPGLYLGFKLYSDGRYEEVYNGPGSLLTREFGHRKGWGEKLHSMPIARLRTLSREAPEHLRVPRRLEPSGR